MGLELHEPALGRSRVAPVGISGWTDRVVWLADSQSFLLTDEESMREIDLATGLVRWSRPCVSLVEKLWGELPPVQDDQPAGPPRRFRPSRVLRDGEHMTVQVLVTPAQAPSSLAQLLAKPPEEQMAWHAALEAGPWRTPVFYSWHSGQPPASLLPSDLKWGVVQLDLPSQNWRLLGPADLLTTYDPAGRWRVEFVSDADDRASVQRTDLATNESETLATGLPLPTSLHVDNLNRVFWTTQSLELWMLPLEPSGDARKLWPKPKDGK